mmetsp:Transcript_23024/g.35607  ORF Transcript_23024/g.35607 Transcript_23024/m.35607 type:complete len:100 (+) Transcript_23024:145-444(+)
MHKSKNAFFSSLSADYFGGFPGYYLSSRESMSSVEQAASGGPKQFYISVYGPSGLKERLLTSTPFMGRMRYLRAVEYSLEEAKKEKNEFGLAEVVEKVM